MRVDCRKVDNIICRECCFRETCAIFANQLSQGITASLAIGTSGEREPFLQGRLALSD